MGEQCEAEQRRTIEIGARFALFAEKNAILGFNASLGTYLKAQIESLQNRIPPDPQSPTSTFFRASSISEDRWTATTRSGGSSSRPSGTSATMLTVQAARETCSRPCSRGVSPKAGAYSLAAGQANERGLLSGDAWFECGEGPPGWPHT